MPSGTQFFHPIEAPSPQAKPWVTNDVSTPKLRLSLPIGSNAMCTATQNEDDDGTDTSTLSNLPQYGDKPEKPGLYIGLFHGRSSPTKRMHDWGLNGPLIGPLLCCHTTYATGIQISFIDPKDAVQYHVNDEFSLKMDGDLVLFDGMYYGDWVVFHVSPEECKRPEDTFRPNRRQNTKTVHSKAPSQ